MQYSGGVSGWHAQTWDEVLGLQAKKREISCGQRHPSERGIDTGISEGFFVLIVATGAWGIAQLVVFV